MGRCFPIFDQFFSIFSLVNTDFKSFCRQRDGHYLYVLMFVYLSDYLWFSPSSDRVFSDWVSSFWTFGPDSLNYSPLAPHLQAIGYCWRVHQHCPFPQTPWAENRRISARCRETREESQWIIKQSVIGVLRKTFTDPTRTLQEPNGR